MSDIADVTDIHRPGEFTIDGRPYETTQCRQPAAALLRLAGPVPVLHALRRMRALGANVTPVDGGPGKAHAAARDLAGSEPGCLFVSDGEPAAVA